MRVREIEVELSVEVEDFFNVNVAPQLNMSKDRQRPNSSFGATSL